MRKLRFLIPSSFAVAMLAGVWACGTEFDQGIDAGDAPDGAIAKAAQEYPPFVPNTLGIEGLLAAGVPDEVMGRCAQGYAVTAQKDDVTSGITYYGKPRVWGTGVGGNPKQDGGVNYFNLEHNPAAFMISKRFAMASAQSYTAGVSGALMLGIEKIMKPNTANLSPYWTFTGNQYETVLGADGREFIEFFNPVAGQLFIGTCLQVDVAYDNIPHL